MNNSASGHSEQEKKMCKLSTPIQFVVSHSPWGSTVVDTLLCFDPPVLHEDAASQALPLSHFTSDFPS